MRSAQCSISALLDRPFPHCGAAILSCCVFLGAVCAPAVEPGNDCAEAPAVADGAYSGSPIGTGAVGVDVCGVFSDADAWYRYIAPHDGLLSLELHCDPPSCNHSLSVWLGCPADGGVELTCSEAGESPLDLLVTAAQQYFIRIAGPSDHEGRYTLNISTAPSRIPSGPDILASDLTEILAFRPEDGVRAYITDTHACNAGDTDMSWGDTSPLMTWNAYRLAQGRLEQIGVAWVKHGFHANPEPGCGLDCRGQGGDVLEAGCKDVYSASFNTNQDEMGPRSAVNAFTGAYADPGGECQIDVSICRYLQIPETDLDAEQYPDALYFFEVLMIHSDDAARGNAANNASYRRVTLDENLLFTPAGPMIVGTPALHAWREHGLGLNTPDPDVSVQLVTVPGEGQFHLANTVRDLGNGSWRYEYALFNLNSHQSARSFSVALPQGINVTNIGFHDVDYHSGEIFDGTDWSAVVDAESITWSTLSFDDNPDANALRFGTQYNFWFEANAAPADGRGEIGLFRLGDHASVNFEAKAPQSNRAPSAGDGAAARAGPQSCFHHSRRPNPAAKS